MNRRLIDVSLVVSSLAVSLTGIHGLPGDPISCLKEKTVQLMLPGRCSYDLLFAAVEEKMSGLRSCRDNHPDFEIMAMLNVGTVNDAKKTLDRLCNDALVPNMKGRAVFEFDSFSNMDYDFNKAFFDGRSSWNYGGMTFKQAQKAKNNPITNSGGASNKFHGNSKRISFIAQNVAGIRTISWPDNFENFDRCATNSAMCCWVDHDESQDDHYKKNTDICYVDYSRAPLSSHIHSGMGIFDGSENAFCHGFAWEDDSLNDVFKGNLLFLSEIYENMHNRGLSKSLPGAPMCGCVEKMPVVTRADCSKLEWRGNFIFRHAAFLNYTNLVLAQGQATLDVVECDGIDGRTNDLGMYYQNLYLEGKVNETQKTQFDKLVVGNGNCTAAIQEITDAFFVNQMTKPIMDPTAESPVPSMTRTPINVPSLKPITYSRSDSPTQNPAPATNKPMTSSPTNVPSSTPITASYSNLLTPTPVTGIIDLSDYQALRPSSSPRMTSEPSSSSLPSATPSSLPSNMPTISISPTDTTSPSDAPTKLPEYQFVGYGGCLSSLNQTYDYSIRPGGGSQPNQCLSYCIKQEGFVGFATANSHYCYCYYEDDFLPKICPRDRNCYSQFVGIGPVAYSQGGNPVMQCYKYRWGLPMMPSSQPSASMPPSLSPSTTSNPVSSPSSLPSSMPTISISPTVTTSPSDAPSTSHVPTMLPEYQFVGYGGCLSSLNQTYDYSIRPGGGSQPNQCLSYCIKQEGFVGFATAYSHYCYCYYEDDFLPKICPRDRNCYSQFVGIGPVAYSQGGNPVMQCYKYRWDLPMMPSSQPSASMLPSSSPSTTSNPVSSPSSLPSSMPTISISPTVTTSPSDAPSTSHVPTMLPEYQFVGYGGCLSSLNQTYDYSIRPGGGSQPNQCLSYCIKQEGFVGFATAYSHYCYCYYEDDFLPKICPRDRNCYSQFVGIGPVAYSQGGNPVMQCYKYRWDLPMMPSSQPSASMLPSSSPSTTSNPVSSPSSLPSSMPTILISPTVTTSPSDAPSTSHVPTTLPEYQFVGYGGCLSSLNQTYDYSIRPGGGSQPNQCLSYCIKQEGFVGFATANSHYCYCYYEDDFLPKICPRDRNCYSQFVGIGPVAYSQGGNPVMQCYKYRWGLPMMPSSQPSASMPPSLSPSMTSNPVSSPSSLPSSMPTILISPTVTTSPTDAPSA
eukprot:CCRYP_013045-RA/>CCRYP_013045-RA protein AED:0.08 eAED:0.08 QI:177/0.92/0.64/1/0.92/0.85/14/257/1181